MQAISVSASPEEAARLGRDAERRQHHLMRPDWAQAKLEAMRRALHVKFETHSGPRRMLLETATGHNSSTPLQVSAPPNHSLPPVLICKIIIRKQAESTSYWQ